MAQKYLIELIDDIDGTNADQTITFALDGKNYAIDLNNHNATNLRGLLEPYLNAARKANVSTSKTKSINTSKPDLAAIRDWAKTNGYQIAERGRIAANIQTAYDAAH